MKTNKELSLDVLQKIEEKKKQRNRAVKQAKRISVVCILACCIMPTAYYLTKTTNISAPTTDEIASSIADIEQDWFEQEEDFQEESFLD